ncbi:tRNA (cytidine/uridine-2'-O-)-methyltransferase [Apostasia shenzhenica]|uniref:tRNA (Cytidine/uridine-2'-O-)-methyltransferase n=1 Tax=Apostasia shenzhenica TaxID=1088818 RepID=A0A2H9ZVI7_9ASPA|nr:tRNA (cytidine/uridine-2'-O-)-methyltransferase [Apostasia shenzhenica]
MEAAGLGALNLRCNLVHFRSWPVIRPVILADLMPKGKRSPVSGILGCLSFIQEGLRSRPSLIHSTAFIPGNTGSIARTCAASAVGLHLVEDFTYRSGDWLVFGSETSGLPPEALLDCSREGMGGGAVRIPMVETHVRSLNLSVSVGIALYEAARQLNYEQLRSPADLGTENQSLFIKEDHFA